MSADRIAWALSVVLVMYAAAAPGTCESQDQSSAAAPRSDTTSQAQTSQRVRIASAVSTGYLIKKSHPKYPAKAREAHIQGTVVLNANISKHGDIEDLSVVSGDPLLAESALTAVRKWKYKPYILKGQPVAIETQIRVDFTLSGN